MGKRILGLWLAVALVLGLAGCMSRGAEEMFALPRPPEDYQNLNQKIEEVLRATGGESIAPQTGSNTQTVQLQDLDGDGFQESAVAFFRVSTAEKPLRIYIFRRQADSSYELDTCIEGVGSSIYSVAYEDVGGGLKKEVVVSWQISATDHTLGVYSLDDVEGIEVLWVDRYTRFHVSDLDVDGEKEVTVITLGSGEESVTRVDYYDYDGAALAHASTASLSAGVNEIKSVRGGYLVGQAPAVFVTSSFGDSSARVVDVLAYRDGALTNVTLDPETQVSGETVRSYNQVGGSDINGDGAMELPRPMLLPKGLGMTGDQWLLEWRQFDLQGTPTPVFTTFHNSTDGWYFVVPEPWVSKICVSRRDSTSADERAVVFSWWRGEEQEAEPFLVFYKLTGTSRTKRAAQGQRKTLVSDSSVIYAYELVGESSQEDLSADEIAERFHIIRTEWSTES